jgi:outer membrane immunogenic protein
VTRSRLLAVALFALLPSAYAQEFPRAEVFGGYSYLNIDTEGVGDRVSAHGWAASATVNVNSWLGVMADFSGHYKPDCASLSGLTCRDYSYLFGPKLSHRLPDSKAVPFGYGLVGAHNVGAGLLGVTVSQNSFAFAVGGGFDYAVTRNISIRVAQVDYLFTRHLQQIGGTHQNNIRAAAGVVFAFGAHHAVNQPTTVDAPQVAQSGGLIEIPSLGIVGVRDSSQGGMAITSVLPNSPAAKAGLTRGDVITGVNGKAVMYPEQVQSEVAKTAPGASVRVRYRYRGTWEGEVTVELQ